MSRKRYSPAEIINKLREAEVLLSQDKTVGQAVSKLGVSEQTYYRWKRIWWPGQNPGPEVEGTGKAESAAQEVGGGSVPG